MWVSFFVQRSLATDITRKDKGGRSCEQGSDNCEYLLKNFQRLLQKTTLLYCSGDIQPGIGYIRVFNQYRWKKLIGHNIMQVGGANWS